MSSAPTLRRLAAGDPAGGERSPVLHALDAIVDRFAEVALAREGDVDGLYSLGFDRLRRDDDRLGQELSAEDPVVRQLEIGSRVPLPVFAAIGHAFDLEAGEEVLERTERHRPSSARSRARRSRVCLP